MARAEADALKKVKDGDDIEAIKKATEELSQAAQKIGEAMYKAQSASSADKQETAGEKSQGEEKKAEEGQYEEVKK